MGREQGRGGEGRTRPEGLLLPGVSGGRGAARERGGGAAWQSVGVGWEEAGPPPPACPPAPLPPPPAPPRVRSPACCPVPSSRSPSLHATSLEVGPRVRWGGEGVAPQAPPAPTPTRPYARGAGHDCLPPVNGRGPRGADPPVASGGLCGVTGGGSPSRVRLPCPAASRRRPWAGLPRPVVGRPPLWACRAGRQAPPHAFRASGLSPAPRPPPPPRLLRPSVRLSGPLFASPVPRTCALARLAPSFPSEPLPSALGGGVGGRVPGNAGAGRAPPRGGPGREDGVRRGRPHRGV